MRFRKKPVEIEAVQFIGTNDQEINDFVGFKKFDVGGYDPHEDRPTWRIYTLEGLMTAEVGDWIIRGVAGEYYPCKPDIFAATYELVDESQGLDVSETESREEV